jgi:hypothetical protein
MGQRLPDVAGRFLDQQSEELPFCVSQRQLPGQQERQQGFSGCRFGLRSLDLSELADGNLSGVQNKSSKLLQRWR